MQFPLQLSFKLIALAPQLTVSDAAGRTVAYVQQKLFRLKEAVTVYADERKAEVGYRIAADRVIDFSAQYHFSAADGRALGAVRRRGMRSLWRAHYEVLGPDEAPAYRIEEENPWVKMADGLIGEVPVLGMFSGYFLHPSYAVKRGEEVVLRMRKQPAMWEGRFAVEQLQPLAEEEQERLMLSLVMLVLLERARG